MNSPATAGATIQAPSLEPPTGAAPPHVVRQEKFPAWMIVAAILSGCVVLGSLLAMISSHDDVSQSQGTQSATPQDDMASPLGRAINAARLMRLVALHQDNFGLAKLQLMQDGSACYTYSALDGDGDTVFGSAILSARDVLTFPPVTRGLDFDGEVDQVSQTKFDRMWRVTCRGPFTDETDAANKTLESTVY